VAGGFNTFRAEAMASGPIVRDKVMASAAVLRGVADGFVRDLDHPGHPLGGEDVMAARAKVLVALNRRTDLLVSADATSQDPTPLTYAKVLQVKPGFQVDNPADLHEVHASTLAEGHDHQYGAAAQFTMRVTPATTLTSLTAFRELDYNVINDSDITELALTSVDLRERQHQLSEELTISHRLGSLQWLGGVFLFAEEDRQPTAIRNIAASRTSFLSPRVATDSQAVFGQATLALTRRLSVTGGLRYTREDKHIDNLGEFTSDADGVLPGGYSYSDAISYDAWTPKAGLEVHASRNTLAYVSATRGFKSGGFNFTSPEPGRGFAPEAAWSYEGGVKSARADGRARMSVAVFHTDYTNLQVQTAIRPGVIDTSNAAAATIRGVEVEGDATLSPVGVGGHLAWLDARYDDYFAVGVGGVSGDVAGNRLNNAPLLSGRLWLQWNHDLGRAFRLSLRADTRWQSTIYFTPFNDSIQRQGGYALLGVSADLAQGQRWTVSVYGRNLLDAGYITGSFGTPLPAFGGRPGRPRELGVQLTVQR
jgi:iron complex outermembrane receptor protein